MKKKDLILNFIKDRSVNNDFRGVKTSEVAQHFGMQRSNVSIILNQLVNEKILVKNDTRPVLYNLRRIGENIEDAFSQLFSLQDSLENQIKLAKAAILYPETSLYTLVYGESGTGRTYFVNAMYEFAKNYHVISDTAIKVEINFADFPSQELLFFNENVADEKDYFIMLDHIEKMSNELKTVFFNKLQQFKCRKKILVCITNESEKLYYSNAFWAQFPIKIGMPSLREISLNDRLEIIQKYFTDEAKTVKKSLVVNAELMRSLLLYRCEENLKQLKSDIKIGCANAYVREYNTDDESLHLHFCDFPYYVRKGLIFYKEKINQLEKVVPQESMFIFAGEQMIHKKTENVDLSQGSNSIYAIIDNKMRELQERKVNDEDINTIINASIDNIFNKYTSDLNTEIIDLDSITKMVDEKIITLVKEFLDEAGKMFHRIYSASIFCGLCLHLESILSGGYGSYHISNDNIMEVVDKNKEEYAFCIQFANKIESIYNVKTNIDDIVIMTMFLTKEAVSRKKRQLVLLLVMHGQSTASSIAEVARTLTKSEGIYSYDLLLDKKMDEVYEELKQMVIEINRGLGVLVLYDMGSIKTMIETISSETNIEMKMIELPVSLIAIDCAWRIGDAESLDILTQGLTRSYSETFQIIKDNYLRVQKSKVIITLCNSGKGAAMQMKKYILEHLDTAEIDVLSIATNNHNQLYEEINAIKRNHEILAVIGTYNPKIYNIPFISISKLFSTPKDKLSMLLALENEENISEVNYTDIFRYLKKNLTMIDIEQFKDVWRSAVRQIKKEVSDLTLDQELGILMHVACLIDCSLSDQPLPVHGSSKRIISRNKTIYHSIKDIMSQFEEEFGIKIDDGEIAYLIRIIKCL